MPRNCTTQVRVQRPDAYAPTMDGKIKAPPAARRMGLVGLEIFGISAHPTLLALPPETSTISMAPSAIPGIGECAVSHDRAGR